MRSLRVKVLSAMNSLPQEYVFPPTSPRRYHREYDNSRLLLIRYFDLCDIFLGNNRLCKHAENCLYNRVYILKYWPYFSKISTTLVHITCKMKTRNLKTLCTLDKIK